MHKVDSKDSLDGRFEICRRVYAQLHQTTLIFEYFKHTTIGSFKIRHDVQVYSDLLTSARIQATIRFVRWALVIDR